MATADTKEKCKFNNPKKLVKTKSVAPETVPTDTEGVAGLEANAEEDNAVNSFTRIMKKKTVTYLNLKPNLTV